MRLPIILAYIGIALLVNPPAKAADSHVKTHHFKKTEVKTRHPENKSQRLRIQVADANWGNASRQDIEKLLYAVAEELWTYFPKRSLKSIVVMPSAAHPLTAYDKGPRGEYVVYLSARDRRWSQYAYQFAHEFAHILSNYDRHGDKTVPGNQWFEETLCEAAALFTLRRMSESWQLSDGPLPYPDWQGYAPAFERYAEHFLQEVHRKLPPGTSLADWYRDHRKKLRHDPYLREKNELVANLLLPLFEENPEYWDAIGYLNLDDSDATASLPQYLETWHKNAPDQYKPLVEEIIAMFGLGERTTLVHAGN